MKIEPLPLAVFPLFAFGTTVSTWDNLKILIVRNGVEQLLLVRTAGTARVVMCWAFWALWSEEEKKEPRDGERFTCCHSPTPKAQREVDWLSPFPHMGSEFVASDDVNLIWTGAYGIYKISLPLWKYCKYA